MGYNALINRVAPRMRQTIGGSESRPAPAAAFFISGPDRE